MILTDAGPLVALIDADEAAHVRCRDALDLLTLPMLTTWPAFTEAMYLIGRHGWKAQALLWELIHSERLVIVELSSGVTVRMSELMRKYADRPMDLADASLVALAEERGLREVFSLDADFQIHRLRGRHRFRVLPE